MPQNPFAVQDFRVGGLSATMNISSSAGFVSIIKSTPGVAYAVNCLGSGAISFYDVGSYNTATSVSSALSTAFAASNQFLGNSSFPVNSSSSLAWPCSNGIGVSVSGGVYAIRFS